MKSIIISLTLIIILGFFYFSGNKAQNSEAKESNQKMQDSERKVSTMTGGVAGSAVDNGKEEKSRRINVLNSADAEEKKLLNKEELQTVISKVKYEGTFKEMVTELNEMTELEVVYLSASSPGVSYDENYPSKDVSGLNMNFDMENIPFGEIIRYSSQASGLKYKVDLENGIVTLAELGVVLEEQQTENYSELYDHFNSLEIEGESKPEEKFKTYLNNLGVSFNAGSRINLDDLSITNSADQHKKIKAILEALKAK